ncbi:MAG: hypothetical protein U9Q05_07755, partial [Thermodesulfobacteriota bacterium]|nr:hypothetical protein [Thermodesulfobacteriota bacterium]
GYGVASMASYNQYETIGAPCIQTKIRRNLGPIYYFRGPKMVDCIFSAALKQAVTDFRKQFLTMPYCFNVEDFQDLFEKIHDTATRNHLPWPDGQGP